LKLSDIHLQEKFIHVREEVAKTRQARFLPLSPPMSQALKRIISVRHPAWDKDGIVLCNHFGERMDTDSLQERFRDYSLKIGIKVTTYMLRHCFAIQFIRNGGDAFALQRIMGHTRLDQTKEYVNLVRADITNGHLKASPLHTFLAEQKRLTTIPRVRKYN
jgi:integrase/recombinase XerD